MRVTNYGLSIALSNILNNDQSTLSQLSVDAASGSLVQQPSDNPAAMALMLQDQEQIGLNQQGQQTSAVQTATLSQTDTVLQTVTQGLGQAQTLLVEAQNGTLTASDLTALASQLQGILGNMVSLSNTESGVGRYLFNGTSSATPFTQTATSITYNGNQNTSTVSLSPGTEITVGEPGTAIFLAQTDMATGSPQSAGVLGLNGTFTVDGQTVTVTAGMTLAQIATAINGANAGVSATTVPVAGGQQELQISSVSTNPLVLVDGGAGVLQSLGIVNAMGAIVNETKPNNLFDALQGALTDLQTNNVADLANRLTELQTAQTTVSSIDAYMGSQQAVAQSTNTRLQSQDSAIQTAVSQISGASQQAEIYAEFQTASTAYNAAIAAAQTALQDAKTAASIG